jgi:hypothetical protein
MDHDVTRLEWLSQRIEYRRGELWRFVEKENASTRTRHRARANHSRPAAHNRNGRRRVMRRDKWWARHQLPCLRTSREGRNAGDLECVAGSQVGQKVDESFRQHGFSCSRRPQQKHVVTPGCCGNECVDDVRLPDDVGQVA